MTKAITKSRKASKRSSQDSFLGLSMIRLSGFRICQLVEKESSNTSLSEPKTLRELIFSHNTK